jgi:hypothetical protein
MLLCGGEEAVLQTSRLSLPREVQRPNCWGGAALTLPAPPLRRLFCTCWDHPACLLWSRTEQTQVFTTIERNCLQVCCGKRSRLPTVERW